MCFGAGLEEDEEVVASSSFGFGPPFLDDFGVHTHNSAEAATGDARIVRGMRRGDFNYPIVLHGHPRCFQVQKDDKWSAKFYNGRADSERLGMKETELPSTPERLRGELALVIRQRALGGNGTWLA